MWRTVRLLAVGRRPIPARLRGERRLLLAVAGLRRLLVRRLLPGYRRPVGRLLPGYRRWGVRRLLPVWIRPGLAVLSRSRTRRLGHGLLPSQAMRVSVVSARFRGARMRSLLGPTSRPRSTSPW